MLRNSTITVGNSRPTNMPFSSIRQVWCHACACVALVGCSAQEEALPEGLYGRWVTQDARYEGRYFEVLPGAALEFGQGAGSTHGGEVTSVVSSPGDGDSKHCEIGYSNVEGTEFTIALEFSPEGGSLSFENSPKVLWRRQEGQP